jgi:hypothetical protein
MRELNLEGKGQNIFRFVLLVKVGWRRGKELGSELCSEQKNEAEQGIHCSRSRYRY